MKQPKLSDLTIDRVGTKKLRSRLKKAKNVKITINIDEQSLTRARKVYGQLGIPYQQILSQVLKEAAGNKDESQSRLSRIEREIEKLKRQIAA